MLISITLGKARLVPVTVLLSDSSVETTSTITLETNQADCVKLAVNPLNNREVGILALAATSGADVVVRDGAFSDTLTVAVTAPTLAAVHFGAPGGEIDPPSWLTA